MNVDGPIYSIIVRDSIIQLTRWSSDEENNPNFPYNIKSYLLMIALKCNCSDTMFHLDSSILTFSMPEVISDKTYITQSAQWQLMPLHKYDKIRKLRTVDTTETKQCKPRPGTCYRPDSRFAPSQWETDLLCNGVSHWLSATLKSTLCSSRSFC